MSVVALVSRNNSGAKVTHIVKDFAPNRGFVEHVLQCSKSQIPVIQAALCYLEAVWSRIPELSKQEKNGFRDTGPDVSQRITRLEDVKLELRLSA